MSLGKQIFSGVIWTSMEAVINRLFSFLIKLFLARILFPEDFGLVGMATVFTSFIQVFNDLGMGAALVQRKETKLTQQHYNTAFWTGIVWSVIVYLVISFLVAPLAAWFYKQELLRTIIPVLSLGVLAGPINLVHRAQLIRSLNFKKTAFINNSSGIFSGILSLILAFAGFGVWALVFNSVSAFIIAMPLYFRATGWKPKVEWSKQCFKDIFGFGIYTTGTQLFNKLISQIDYLIIGKLLGASALGIYSFAFMFTDAFRGHMMLVINKVMFPLYAKIQDDHKNVIHYYLQVVKFNSIVIYPVMVFIIVFAESFMPVVFGVRWLESVPPMQILAVSVMVHMLVNSSNSLMRGIGRPGLELKLQMVKSIFMFVPFIVAGTYYMGLIGTALGYLIAKILSVALSLIVMRRILGIDLSLLLHAVWRPLVASLCAGILSKFALYLGVHWIISACLFAMVALGMTFLLSRGDFDKIKKMISAKIS